MPFDIAAFKTALVYQCRLFNVECSQAWSLGPGVFAAQARLQGESDWAIIFYFDARETKPRDRESGADCMEREIQLYMMLGYTVTKLTREEDDYVRISYFHDGPAPDDPVQLVNYASQLFARVDNEEIEWPDRATTVSIE